MRKRGKGPLIGIAAILIGLLVMLITTDSVLRPLVLSYAEKSAEMTFNKVVNAAILNTLQKESIDYNQLAEITKDKNDQIVAVKCDTIKLTKLKADIANEIIGELDKSDKIHISIPVGTITGNAYLVGRGPSLHFDFKLTGTVVSSLDSKFYAAGINQTLHQITLNLDSNLSIVMPWYRTSKGVNTNYILAETVIIGQVPDSFTNIDLGGSITQDLFNFGKQ